jgi:hypothetical protein
MKPVALAKVREEIDQLPLTEEEKWSPSEYGRPGRDAPVSEWIGYALELEQRLKDRG